MKDKIIYTKENDYEYKTMLIEDGQPIPEGWVERVEELNLKFLDSYFSNLIAENNELKENQEIIMSALVELAKNQSIQEEGITELANLFSNIEGGVIND